MTISHSEIRKAEPSVSQSVTLESIKEVYKPVKGVKSVTKRKPNADLNPLRVPARIRNQS